MEYYKEGLFQGSTKQWGGKNPHFQSEVLNYPSAMVPTHLEDAQRRTVQVANMRSGFYGDQSVVIPAPPQSTQQAL